MVVGRKTASKRRAQRTSSKAGRRVWNLNLSFRRYGINYRRMLLGLLQLLGPFCAFHIEEALVD